MTFSNTYKENYKSNEKKFTKSWDFAHSSGVDVEEEFNLKSLVHTMSQLYSVHICTVRIYRI